MNKRIVSTMLLILSFVIIVAAVQHKHKRKGFTTDLAFDDVQDALKILKDERSMWSQFTNLSGHIDLALSSANGAKSYYSFQGDLSLRQIAFSTENQNGGAWKYELVLANPAEGWTMTTDGTPQNTKLDCTDKEKAKMINALAPALTQLLPAPKHLLVPLYRDSLFPQGAEDFKQVFGSFGPFHNTNAVHVAHSYVFKETNDHFNQLFFTAGHISGWLKVKNESGCDSLSFESPVNLNGFWYPSIIKVSANGTLETLSLSHIVVNAPPDMSAKRLFGLIVRDKTLLEPRDSK